MREEVLRARQRRLEELTEQNEAMGVRPELMVRFGIASEQILEASHELKADLVRAGRPLKVKGDTDKADGGNKSRGI
jgi:nucleotide-binding universal stress UspA family protein